MDGQLNRSPHISDYLASQLQRKINKDIYRERRERGEREERERGRERRDRKKKVLADRSALRTFKSQTISERFSSASPHSRLHRAI